MIKILHRILSLTIASMFVMELLLLIFSDFSNNYGSSKVTAIVFFIFCYSWSLIPSILLFLFFKKIIIRQMVSYLILIVNFTIIIYLIPMFLAYIK